jgi:hypothetical protein
VIEQIKSKVGGLNLSNNSAVSGVLSKVSAVREKIGGFGEGNIAQRIESVKNLRPMIQQGITGGAEFIGQGEAAIRGARESISLENTDMILKDMLNVLVGMRDGERMRMQFERGV